MKSLILGMFWVSLSVNALFCAERYADHRTEVLIAEVANYIGHHNKTLPDLVKRQWATIFVGLAKKHKVPVFLALQVSQVESGILQITPHGYSLCSRVGSTFQSCAGAEGVMQVMPKYWGNGECPYASKPSDLKHATINIGCGVYVLSHYYNKYQNWEHALVAYNAGPRGVRLLIKGKDITAGYVNKVLNI